MKDRLSISWRLKNQTEDELLAAAELAGAYEKQRSHSRGQETLAAFNLAEFLEKMDSAEDGLVDACCAAQQLVKDLESAGEGDGERACKLRKLLECLEGAFD